ncbi:MAG TPA: hypothetical protein VKK61_12210, partial [Tepidisphaeraceae bacterium]|nr:hypothetical protein [Tepidisphaeraceae bacterium]
HLFIHFSNWGRVFGGEGVMSFRIFLVLCAAIVCLCISSRVQAQPFFSGQASLDDNGVNVGSDSHNGAISQTAQSNYNQTVFADNIDMHGFATAGRGFLQASARSTNSPSGDGGGPPGPQDETSTGTAEFAVDDLIFSGPTNGTIPVTMLMSLNGTISANVGGPSGTAAGSIGIQGNFSGSNFFGFFPGIIISQM